MWAKVYTCQLRQDAAANYTINTDWNNGYIFTNSFPNNIGNAGSITTSSLIDSTPFQSPYFLFKYKVIDVKKFMIEAGVVVRHQIDVERENIMQAARLQTSAIVAVGRLTTVRL